MHTTGGYMVGAYSTFKYVFDVQPDAGDVWFCTADLGGSLTVLQSFQASVGLALRDICPCVRNICPYDRRISNRAHSSGSVDGYCVVSYGNEHLS